MRSIAKFYPQKGKDTVEEIVKKVQKSNLDGLTVTYEANGEAHYHSRHLPYSGFSLKELKKSLNKKHLELGLGAPFFFSDGVWENSPAKRAKIGFNDWPTTNWYRPLCPVYPGLFEDRLTLLLEAVEEIEPDFVGLDFFRFPLFWEELDEEMKLITCDCPDCPAKGGRTEVIYQYAIKVKEALASLPVMIHLVPFLEENTIKVTGQDPKLLANALDSLSPMLYSNLLKREDTYIYTTLEKLAVYKIWPSLEITKREINLLRSYDKVLYFYLG